MIRESKDRFSFGNCACVAIAGAFDMDVRSVGAIFDCIGVDARQGVTFYECKRVINLLARSCGRRIIYRKCTVNASYEAICKVLMDGTYIVHFDHHLSLLEEGVVYDTYLENNDEKFKSWQPTGWWVIKY